MTTQNRQKSNFKKKEKKKGPDSILYIDFSFNPLLIQQGFVCLQKMQFKVIFSN